VTRHTAVLKVARGDLQHGGDSVSLTGANFRTGRELFDVAKSAGAIYLGGGDYISWHRLCFQHITAVIKTLRCAVCRVPTENKQTDNFASNHEIRWRCSVKMRLYAAQNSWWQQN